MAEEATVVVVAPSNSPEGAASPSDAAGAVEAAAAAAVATGQQVGQELGQQTALLEGVVAAIAGLSARLEEVVSRQEREAQVQAETLALLETCGAMLENWEVDDVGNPNPNPPDGPGSTASGSAPPGSDGSAMPVTPDAPPEKVASPPPAKRVSAIRRFLLGGA